MLLSCVILFCVVLYCTVSCPTILSTFYTYRDKYVNRYTDAHKQNK